MLALYQAKLDRVNEQLEALLDLKRMLERQIRVTVGKRPESLPEAEQAPAGEETA